MLPSPVETVLGGVFWTEEKFVFWVCSVCCVFSFEAVCLVAEIWRVFIYLQGFRCSSYFSEL